MALRRIATISALTLSVLLTACGGGSSGSTTTSSTTSTAAPNFTAATAQVTTFATVPASMGNGVAVDSQGNVYAESGTSILKYPASGGTPTTFATIPNTSYLGFILIDSQNNLYVGSYTIGNNTSNTAAVYKYSLSGGSPVIFNTPFSAGLGGLAIDSSNNLYIGGSTATSGEIIKFSGGSNTATPTTIITTSSTGLSYWNPSGMEFDSNGNLFVADTLNNNVEKIDSSGHFSVIAGNSSNPGGYYDATGTAAVFNIPFGITIDASNNLYVTDYQNNVIRKISSAAVVTTIAGIQYTSSSTNPPTNTNQNGAGNIATFNNPVGITIDSSGNLYVADKGNSEIRKIVP